MKKRGLILFLAYLGIFPATLQAAFNCTDKGILLFENSTKTIFKIIDDDFDTTVCSNLSTSISVAPLHGNAVLNGHEIEYTPDTDFIGI